MRNGKIIEKNGHVIKNRIIFSCCISGLVESNLKIIWFVIKEVKIKIVPLNWESLV